MKTLCLLLAVALATASLGLAACSDTPDSSAVTLLCSDEAGEDNLDLDEDGYSPCDGDCDDADPNANPGTPEESETDQYDQDCDNFNPARE